MAIAHICKRRDVGFLCCYRFIGNKTVGEDLRVPPLPQKARQGWGTHIGGWGRVKKKDGLPAIFFAPFSKSLFTLGWVVLLICVWPNRLVNSRRTRDERGANANIETARSVSFILPGSNHICFNGVVGRRVSFALKTFD